MALIRTLITAMARSSGKAFLAIPGAPLGLVTLVSICAGLPGCFWSRAWESDRGISATYELEERFTCFKLDDRDFAQKKGGFLDFFFS